MALKRSTKLFSVSVSLPATTAHRFPSLGLELEPDEVAKTPPLSSITRKRQLGFAMQLLTTDTSYQRSASKQQLGLQLNVVRQRCSQGTGGVETQHGQQTTQKFKCCDEFI